MNHVFGNGEASPYNDKAEAFSYPTKKNEYKSKSFIVAKHCVASATKSTFESATKFVELYLLLSGESEKDKAEIKSLLCKQFKKIYYENI